MELLIKKRVVIRENEKHLLAFFRFFVLPVTAKTGATLLSAKSGRKKKL